MNGRITGGDPETRPGETKPPENETKPGKSETIRVDEKTARRAGTSISPAWPTKPGFLQMLSTERKESSGARVGHYDFSHTVTEATLDIYARSFPDLKVGDRIQETVIRTARKVIRSRLLNGKPIPWIPSILPYEN